MSRGKKQATTNNQGDGENISCKTLPQSASIGTTMRHDGDELGAGLQLAFGKVCFVSEC